MIREAKSVARARARLTASHPPIPVPAPGRRGPLSATGIPGWPSAGPFAPTSFWNAALGVHAPLEPASSAYVSELIRQVTRYHPWINTYQYSTPVYVVAANQATQHVALDTYGPDLQQEFNAVPLPAVAQPAAGSDEHLTVWQPSTDRLWEFWKMAHLSDGWHARWGGEMDHVSSSPGYFTHVGQTKNWGATATGLPLLGGLITFADLRRGYINHALALAVVEAAPSWFSWPAQRTDGGTFSSPAVAIPEGMRFRLDPSLNIASLRLAPLVAMIAHAAQTYGIVVRDKAGAVTFYGQDPHTVAVNPWIAAFGGQYASTLLGAFPWSHLQALQTQMSCCWSH